MEKLFAIINIDNYLVCCVQSHSADDLAVVFPKEQYTAIEYTIENPPNGNFWDGTQFIEKVTE
jgi:hypothetical protein